MAILKIVTTTFCIYLNLNICFWKIFWGDFYPNVLSSNKKVVWLINQKKVSDLIKKIFLKYKQ